MGIYELFLGKGIIVPVKTFVRKYLDEINAIFTDGEDDEEFLTNFIKNKFGDEFDLSKLGHDALESRHKDMSILDGTDNMQAFNQIKKCLELEKSNHTDLPIDSLGCGDLMFIGYYESICTDCEFSWYVKAPEIIYGLPALIPTIIKCYNKYKDLDCLKLENEFGQTSCIWTFAQDCACCG